MGEVVEGDWKNFVFKTVRSEDDAERILELLRKFFYPNETLCQKVGSGKEHFDKMAEDFKPWVKIALEDNLSFYAEHKDTKKIAGARIISLAKRDEHGKEMPALLYPPDAIVVGLLEAATKKADVFSLYPDINTYADLFMTVTDEEFRGQGLATEMYNRAITLCQAKGIRLCKSVLTSPWTMRACKNLHFTEHEKVFLKDYVDSNGKPYFPQAKPEEHITVVAKLI